MQIVTVLTNPEKVPWGLLVTSARLDLGRISALAHGLIVTGLIVVVRIRRG